MTDRNDYIDTYAIERMKQDKADLNDEIGGVNNGRMKRFLNDGDIFYRGGEGKKQKAEREFHTMLDMLLAQDPIYAALYHEVTEKVEKAQQAVKLALVDINERLEASDRKLQFLRDNAAELADGTKVFKSSINHSIYTEHGKQLTTKDTQNIAFTGNEPSHEEYRETKDARDLAVSQKVEVETYQREVLDPAKIRLHDKEDPALHDELEGMKIPLETDMPNIVKSFTINESSVNFSAKKHSNISVAHELVEETKISTPNMKQSFNVARTDIPDLSSKPETQPLPSNISGL